MQLLDFAFLKDRYDFELRRKEELTNALTMPVGTLGALGSLLAVMVRGFVFNGDATAWAFVFSGVPAVCFFFACLVQLARAYHRQKYKFLPLLRSLDTKLAEWQDFYQQAGFAGAEEDVFAHDLRAVIIDSADRNTENNDARSSLLYWARVWLFWLLGFTTLTGIAYVANQLRFHA